MSSSLLLKQYLSGPAEIGGGGSTASIDNLHQISHAPCNIQDGAPNKKRSCDKQASPISNKKVKETDTAAVLQSNNNEMKDGASAAKLSTEQTTKDNGVPTELHNRQYIKAGETTDNDIYLIRGTDHLPGNKKYNELIQSKKASYQSSDRSGKSAISLSIINELRSQNPPSRFLRIEFGRFYDVGDEEVRKKIVGILGKGARKAQRDSTDSNISVSDGEEQPQQCSALHDICSIAILSQKQFMRSKPTPEKETMNEASVIKSSSPYVEREVSKFLIEEAKHVSPTSQTITKSHKVSPPSQAESTAVVVTSNIIESQLSAETSLQQAQVNNPHTAPKIAIASEETLILNNETSKLPVAFGFNLNDSTSKEFAQEAIEKWTNEGMKAAKSNGNSLRVSIGEGKMIDGVPCVTPKVKTPKTPKTPAILLSTKPAPNLPDGWTVKLFKRQSGATAGSTDKYFYSPDNEIKFRSMKGCNVFIGILDEPDIDADESAALKEYKERGYKF